MYLIKRWHFQSLNPPFCPPDCTRCVSQVLIFIGKVKSESKLIFVQTSFSNLFLPKFCSFFEESACLPNEHLKEQTEKSLFRRDPKIKKNNKVKIYFSHFTFLTFKKWILHRELHQFNESDKCNANSYLRAEKLESKLICANIKEANVSTHSDNSCMKSSGHGGYEDETD